MIPVRAPRRRCVGITVTFVTAAAGTVVQPGSVSGVANAFAVPTIVSPSNAACVRAGSISLRRTFISSSRL